MKIVDAQTPAAPLITDEDVAFFRDNGYLVKRQAIAPDVIDAMREYAADLQARYLQPRREEGVYYTSAAVASFEHMMDGSADQESGAVLWRVDGLEQRMPGIALLKRQIFVHSAMEKLLGTEVLQYNESFVTKPPRIGQTVHWHQDPSFKRKAVDDPISTIDVYLDRADEENGCLWVVPGSHKQGIIDVEPLVEEHGFDLPGAIPVRMEPGDVAFHDNGCLHGSKENRSERERRILYLAFQTMRQVEAGGQFTADFVIERQAVWANYLAEALASAHRNKKG